MTAPQVLIGFGAAILIPYINVFFKDRFAIGDSLLGALFSVSSLMIGIGSLAAPRLAIALNGKIRAIVATQSGSLVFLLLLGFAPYLWLSSVGYLMRTALMNMAAPLYSAFCMERTPEQHQGLVNSVLNLAWSLGWAVGPFISGVVQQRYGFAPLFIATAILYGLASAQMWLLFGQAENAGACCAAGACGARSIRNRSSHRQPADPQTLAKQKAALHGHGGPLSRRWRSRLPPGPAACL